MTGVQTCALPICREELERAALETGMKTLWDDGLGKVVSGLTSLEELARVLV